MLNLGGFLILLLISVVLALGIRAALLPSLHSLLGRTVRVEGGLEFFVRAFSVIVLLACLGPAVGATFSLKPDAQWMEAVWAVATGLGAVIVSLLMSLGAYLVVVTILLAALKPKQEADK